MPAISRQQALKFCLEILTDVDLEEIIKPLPTDDVELGEVTDEDGIASETDIVEPEPEVDEGMENGGTAGDEVTTDADVSETEDTV